MFDMKISTLDPRHDQQVIEVINGTSGICELLDETMIVKEMDDLVKDFLLIYTLIRGDEYVFVKDIIDIIGDCGRDKCIIIIHITVSPFVIYENTYLGIGTPLGCARYKSSVGIF
jgi:hypothetical protein